MAGIYIHFPFCKQACHYCDFHFSTSLKNTEELLAALKKEIRLQKDYLGAEKISTVYFGGGTPSLLSGGEINDIVAELSKYYSIDTNAEITLEANPDDLSKEKLSELSSTRINRLSIGIQSFRDEDLKFLNRAHSAAEAIESVQNAKQAGFNNITIDLIYGIQTLTNGQWKRNLEIAFELGVPHISCYSLTVEPKTALASFIQKGKAEDIDPKKSAEQFEILMDGMKKHNFIHYEISNFCKDGYYSRHNSSYWKGEKYLGLGPSAHSYDRSSRQWNVKSNAVYISSLEKDRVLFERETLSQSQVYNEYILTTLRTIWGIDVEFVRRTFSEDVFLHFQKEIRPFLEDKMILEQDGKLVLTAKGKFFADKIASDLFLVA